MPSTETRRATLLFVLKKRQKKPIRHCRHFFLSIDGQVSYELARAQGLAIRGNGIMVLAKGGGLVFARDFLL